MKDFIKAILAQLETISDVKFVRVWNDQLNLDEQNKQYSFPMPALFPEIVNPDEILQLGDGVQLYEPLIIRIHVLHWQLDATDGTMEQNLDVFDFMDAINVKMNGFEPDGAVKFVRGADGRDYQHAGVYHAIIDYKTNFLDTSNQISTQGTTIGGGVIQPVLNVTYNPAPYLKEK
ncbi:MAG: hypothetical protein V4538_16325 [Bacteroidota bacterium]